MTTGKGMTYTLTDESIKAYMRLSVGEKLEWLEEIQELNRVLLTPKHWRFISILKEEEAE